DTLAGLGQGADLLGERGDEAWGALAPAAADRLEAALPGDGAGTAGLEHVPVRVGPLLALPVGPDDLVCVPVRSLDDGHGACLPGAVRCPSSGRSVARAVRARRGGWGWSSSEVGRSEQVGARGDLEVQPVGVARVQAGVAEGVQLDDADPAVDEREVQGARAAALVPQSRPEL